jgi:hypothetical protein
MAQEKGKRFVSRCDSKVSRRCCHIGSGAAGERTVHIFSGVPANKIRLNREKTVRLTIWLQIEEEALSLDPLCIANNLSRI